ncbi:MAG TPA: exo-alpha-sialidase, partial [Algoriphagus sp.]|nr:exo-alpha-sialidase [Algoriphagus sp.]
PVDYTGDSALLPWTAYSDLVKLDQNKLGILYERNQYQEIIFKILPWSQNF